MLVYRRVQSLEQRPHVSGHTKNQGEGKQRRQKPLKFSKTVSCKENDHSKSRYLTLRLLPSNQGYQTCQGGHYPSNGTCY